jgi:hypothetical protein
MNEDRVAAEIPRHRDRPLAAFEISATTTLAPSREKRTAPARPIPDPLPVMNATLFSSLPITGDAPEDDG